MDPECLDTSQWIGALGARLGQHLYCDLHDFEAKDFARHPGMVRLLAELSTLTRQHDRRSIGSI